MGERCLVTGASGFIGRALCQELTARGRAVRAVMRRPAEGPWEEQVSLDLAAGAPDPLGRARPDRLEPARPDRLGGARPVPAELLADVEVVFHLAGKVHDLAERVPDEAAYQAANVDATRALLAAAVAAGVPRFVFMSSRAVVGDTGRALADESAATPPATPYGRSKLEAERLVLAAGERHGMHVCNLRPALVYGPGAKGNLPRMLEAIDRRRFPPVPELGNRRSLVGVDDVVGAALLAAERQEAAGQTYVVTDGRAYSTRGMYVAMVRALGREPGAVTVPRWCLAGLARAGDLAGRARGRRFVFDSAALERLTGSAWFSAAKIARELGWRPTQTLEAALPAMVAEYRNGALRAPGGPAAA
ncbi:MAG TPA: NAD-dependent epimerase/dehydratase family protein [Actinomycetes bacterium]|jgi:nucleoside-diphosphate-sugar epimerase|nr:NAD-dependent epimerase/dehydratase family protein [Actinomycetes bacterium]